MSAREQDFAELMKLARTYHEEERYTESMKIARKAFKIRPNDPGLLQLMGALYLEQKQPEKAMTNFQKILKLKDYRAKAYCGMGAVASMKVDHSEALRNYKLSLKYGLDDWRIHYNLGITYYILKRVEEALRHLLRFTKKSCSSYRGNYSVGYMFVREEKYPEAEMCLKKALKAKGNSSSSHYLLGIVYAKTKRWGPAIRHLKKSINFGLDPRVVCFDLGCAYLRKGDLDQAKSRFTRLITVNPKNSWGYYGMTLLYLQQREWEQAEEFLNEARQRGLNDDEWYTTLGLIHLSKGSASKGSAEEGVAYYKKAIEKNSDCHIAHAELGCFYDERGETEQAVFHFEKALQLKPADLQTAFRLGLLYLRKNRPDECMKCYEKMSAIENKSPWSQTLLGSCYLSQGNFKEAERAAQRAIEFGKHLPIGYYLLHMIYFEQDKREAAIEYLEKAFKLGQPTSVRDCVNLGLLYSLKPMLKKGRQYLEMASKIDPSAAEPYAFLSGVYLAECNYELSKSAVEMAESKPWKIMRKKDLSVLLTCTKKCASAMANWQAGELQQTENDLSTLTTIAQSNGLADQAREARFLSWLVSFDKRLQLVSTITDPTLQRQEFVKLGNEILPIIMRENDNLSEGEIFGLPIATAKACLILVIIGPMMGQDFDGVLKKLLDDAKKVLENMHLTPPPVLFDLIESYAFDFSNAKAEFGKIEDFPDDVQRSLMEKTSRILAMLGGKMWVEGMARQCAGTLLQDFKKLQTDILSVRTTSEDMFKLVKSRLEPTEFGSEQFSKQGEIEEPKAPVTGIFFQRTKVRVEKGRIFKQPIKQYPWRLLELLLQRQRIHWTYGFLIFDKWRSDPGPKYPKRTINSYIGTLNGRKEDSLSKNRIPIKIEKDTETGEVYLKECDRSKFFSNIFSAEERVKKVKDILSRGDSEALEDAKKSLVDIVDGKEGYYNCYEAYKLLIHYLEKTGFRKEDKRVTTKVAEFFEEKISLYEESFHAIEVHRKRIPQTYYWKGTDEAVDMMRKEMGELEEYYKIIAPRAAKKRVSEDFSDIIRLIREIKNLEPPYESLVKKKAFEELAHEHSIKSMLNSVSLNILKDERLKNVSPKDIVLAILPNFARVITKVRTSHFQSLPPLIKYLKTSTEQRTKEELIEREYEIPANILRDIRRKSKVYNELAQESGQEPRDDKVYKKLGWSKEKQGRIRMYESKLSKVPGFNEQQYKGEMP